MQDIGIYMIIIMNIDRPDISPAVNSLFQLFRSILAARDCRVVCLFKACELQILLKICVVSLKVVLI